MAVAVDAVVGVQELRTLNLAELPPLFHDTHAEVIQAIGAIDAELLLVLQSARMVPESVWQRIDANESRP